MKKYDVIVVGGGAVGTALALALAQQNFSVALIDAQLLEERSNPQTDNRVFALAAGTQAVLTQLGVWSLVAANAHAIEHIHVSNKGSYGTARLHAEDFDIAALGYMLSAVDLQCGLNEAVLKTSVDFYCPAQVVAIAHDDNEVRVDIERDGQRETLLGEFLVGADGARSFVREQLGIDVATHHFEQQAIVALVDLEQAHEQVAYERFTSDGAIALLPYGVKQSVLIWSLPDAQASDLSALTDQQFLTELQRTFGHRLGRFSGLQKRISYPLVQVRAASVKSGRVLLLGNAAQSLHPIAAQGFNLALRHVALLMSFLEQAKAQGTLWAGEDFLNGYVEAQAKDSEHTILFTNTLVRFFSDEGITRFNTFRSGLIAVFDLCPPAKRYLLKGMLKGVGLTRS
jgi:2-octaprenyl-6-methoxyphenol hydroxylase